jgi:hypothetical protein
MQQVYRGVPTFMNVGGTEAIQGVAATQGSLCWRRRLRHRGERPAYRRAAHIRSNAQVLALVTLDGFSGSGIRRALAGGVVRAVLSKAALEGEGQPIPDRRRLKDQRFLRGAIEKPTMSKPGLTPPACVPTSTQTFDTFRKSVAFLVGAPRRMSMSRTLTPHV